MQKGRSGLDLFRRLVRAGRVLEWAEWRILGPGLGDGGGEGEGGVSLIWGCPFTRGGGCQFCFFSAWGLGDQREINDDLIEVLQRVAVDVSEILILVWFLIFSGCCLGFGSGEGKGGFSVFGISRSAGLASCLLIIVPLRRSVRLIGEGSSRSAACASDTIPHHCSLQLASPWGGRRKQNSAGTD
jgi:hypothetical protein